MQFLERSPDVVCITKYFYWNLIANDPDDDKFVDCAIAANADIIVTGGWYFKIDQEVSSRKQGGATSPDHRCEMSPPSFLRR